MIVVDTTVLGDLLFNGGELRKSAEKLLEVDPEWVCLELVRYELGNVARSHVSFGAMEADDADLGIEAINATISEMVREANWGRILQLAIHHDLSYYDASHVWLARSRNLKLHTRDKRILAECGDVAVAMPEV